MKILVIGDFHGKFPAKLKNRIKKEEVDLIVSLGDYFPFSSGKLFFKYCYKTDKELWEVIGKKKYKAIDLKDRKKGKEILKLLDNFPNKIISITGNHDRTKWKEAHQKYDKSKKVKWAWAHQEIFSEISKKMKNIKFFDWSYIKFKGYVFIGYPKSNFPGHVKSKQYKIQREKLEKLFKKFKKENKEGKLIFVSHNIPYDTKLDKIKVKEAHKKAKGKHYGSKLVKRIIQKYKPSLVLCGHMHENPGKDKIGKTIIVNPGAAQDGKAVILDIQKHKIKSIKFLK